MPSRRRPAKRRAGSTGRAGGPARKKRAGSRARSAIYSRGASPRGRGDPSEELHAMVRMTPDDEEVPLDVAARIDDTCDRFEPEWRAGRRPRIEAFLADEPGPWRPELLRRLLAVELAYRRRGGECPTADEYRQRFPEYAGLIDLALGATPIGTAGAGRSPEAVEATLPVTTAAVGPDMATTEEMQFQAAA